jgi:hypothetical protein
MRRLLGLSATRFLLVMAVAVLALVVAGGQRSALGQVELPLVFFPLSASPGCEILLDGSVHCQASAPDPAQSPDPVGTLPPAAAAVAVVGPLELVPSDTILYSATVVANQVGAYGLDLAFADGSVITCGKSLENGVETVFMTGPAGFLASPAIVTPTPALGTQQLIDWTVHKDSSSPTTYTATCEVTDLVTGASATITATTTSVTSQTLSSASVFAINTVANQVIAQGANATFSDFLFIPPSPPPDSDADGVPDPQDACPGTAPGATVDASGCSDSQVDFDGDGLCNPGAPSPGPSNCTGSDPNPNNPDEDNDGIADGASDPDGPGGIAPGPDLCPGTALGDPVDASGCSQAQVGSCTPAPSGLVSWWPGDGNATDIQDGNDGTLQNGATFAAGKVGQAFSFDGVDDFVLVSPSANLNITGDVTVDLWARRSVFGVSDTMVSKGVGFIPEDLPSVYILRFIDNELQAVIELANGSPNVVLHGPIVTDTNFHHYAYVRSGNDHKLFMDGVVVASGAFIGTPGDTANFPLTIGAQRHDPFSTGIDFTNHFSGEIDEVEVFNRDLSDPEIQAIFNAGSAGKCKIQDIDGDGVPNVDDACLVTPGLADRQGCPVGDENLVEIHIIDQAKTGFCPGGARSCKLSIESAQVRVFDRNILNGLTITKLDSSDVTLTKNPNGSLYDDIFEAVEAEVAEVGACTTDASGTCTAGEESIGDYLVIVKASGDLGTAYSGKPKSPGDFDETGLARKDFQFIVVFRKDGSVQLGGGSKTVVAGSYLEILYPDQAVWEDVAAGFVYPFIFTSDSDWTVDVCAQVPEGYAIVGVYDEEGALLSGESCSQTFVSGETRVVAFEVVEVGSPEPRLNAILQVSHEGKVTQVEIEVPGVRTYVEDQGELPAELPTTGAGESGDGTPVWPVVAALAGVSVMLLSIIVVWRRRRA